MARRKIYDIVPPKEASKVEDTVKSLGVKSGRNATQAVVSGEPKKKRVAGNIRGRKKETPIPSTIPQIPVKKKGRFPMREILIGCLIIAILLGIYFFNKLPKAKIEIFPKLDQVVLEDKITADKSVDQVDVKNKLIPLEYFEEVKDASQEFPATGVTSNSGKATGTMTIYNKLSPAVPLTLISGTHFLSDSGKYFVTLAKVTVPAMKGKTPGSINVKVQAEEVGAEYNIGPSTFSIPKLSGTAYYYGIWGESKEKMDGGYTGKVSKATKDDLETAEDVLTERLMKDAESSLKSKISEDEVLLDNSIISEIIDTSATVKPDAITDNFTQSAKVRVQALVFKKQDAETFVKNSILSKIAEGTNLLESSLELNYAADAVDFKKGTVKISIKAIAQTYYDMDINNLPDFLKRKSSDEVERVVDSEYGDKVSKVKVIFWPFWVNRTPKDLNRIEISLSFE